MADSPRPTPISPPTVDKTTTAPPSGPISPVIRSSTFQHASSAGVVSTTMPFIETNTPAINENGPVELDGVSTSIDDIKRRTTGEIEGKDGVAPGLDEEDDIAEEFLGEPGERGAGKSRRENRAAIIASRSKDPSVIVDLPGEPTAEEVQAAKSAEGTVTPGLPPPVRDGLKGNLVEKD